MVAHERFLYTPDLPGPKGKKGSDGLLLAFDPPQYEKVDETEIEGTSRGAGLPRASTRGWVTLGKGWADETELGVGDPITLHGSSGTRHTRVAGIVKTVVFGGQTVGMSLRTMRDGLRGDGRLASWP